MKSIFKKTTIALIVSFYSLSSFAIPADDVKARCQDLVNNGIKTNATVYGTLANQDEALMEIAQKPVLTEKTEDGQDFDCFEQTNDMYQSMLDSVSSVLGEIFGGFLDGLGSLFGSFFGLSPDGSGAGDASKGSCAAARQAVSQSFGFKCPNVSVPYLGNLSCKGGLTGGPNGNPDTFGKFSVGNIVRGSVGPNGLTVRGPNGTVMSQQRSATSMQQQSAAPNLGIPTNPTVNPTTQTAPTEPTTPNSQATIMKRMSCAFNPANCS